MILATPAIYAIRNTTNGKVYIGGASYPAQRWYEHKCALRLGKHKNKQLQDDWSKYGEQGFTFEILEEVEKTRLSEREDFYIENEKNKYNQLSGFTGRRLDSRTRALSITGRAKNHTVIEDAPRTLQINKRFRELRKDAGLSLREIYEQTGLSISYLSDLERGRQDPSLETCRKLAAVYGITLQKLFAGVL